jgi:predicted DNA-binding transcriptional regulator YafY
MEKYMKSTFPRFKRIIYIADQLSKEKYPDCPKLVKDLGKERKTILKDIEIMKDPVNGFGLPIEYDKKKKGYKYTKPIRSFPALFLTEGELFSILVAEKVIKQYENTPYEDNLNKVFNKIIDFLPEKVKGNLKEMGSYIHFSPEVLTNIDKEIHDKISKALNDEYQLEITYLSLKNEETKRIINPHFLTCKHGDWYIVAYCTKQKDFRVFALQRIKSLELLESTFIREEDINIKEITGESLDVLSAKGSYYCEIKIDYPASLYIKEKKWHSTQKIKENQDGSIIISFTVNSIQEVRRWVMSMGANATVIKPDILKEDIKNEIKVMVERHR